MTQKGYGMARPMQQSPEEKERLMARKTPSVSHEGSLIRKLTLTMPINAKKAAAIKRCIEKGELRITVNKIDLKAGRLGEGWLYD
jgi:anti-sigma28 factor (negative regulator of flagellin synthesis)